MKLGLLTCIWKRHELAALIMYANLEAAKAAGLDIIPIAVRSPDDEPAATFEIDEAWTFVDAPNQPLGAKWNAGMLAMKDTKVDAVICFGSDDLISEAVFRSVKEWYTSWIRDKGTPRWFGLRNCFVYHAASGKVRHFRGYEGTTREGEPIGIARTFNTAWLDRYGWKPWSSDAQRGLDATVTLDPQGGTVLLMEIAGAVLDVKAYPGVDINSIWSTEGPWVDAAKTLALFPSAAFGLRALSDQTKHAEPLFTNVPTEPLLTVCYMVRNERDVIAESLVSFRGLADEVLLLDTGSDDGTPEIAEAYGAKVTRVHADLPFDFGKWRNESLSRAHGKWVMIMDGDEWVEDRGNLLELLTKLPETCDAIAVPHHVLGRVGAEGDSPILRIFRGDKVRAGKIYYEFPIHHQVCGYTNFAITTACSWEPYTDPAESAIRAIPTLEKLLAMSTAPGIVGLNGKALGGRNKEQNHALLYLARSYAMIGSSAVAKVHARIKDGGQSTNEEVKEVRLAYERAALYAGKLVDKEPTLLGAWLVLLAVVEACRGLPFCEPLALRALVTHPQSKEIRWWVARTQVAALLSLDAGKDAYPLEPTRAGLFMPKIDAALPFFWIHRLPAPAETAK